MVGLALLRIVPATRAAAGPSPASSSSAASPSGGAGRPAAAAMASIAARTVGISLTGQRCVPILVTAALSRVTAFSGWGLAP